ncbi:Ankyrin repeat and fibronectin type-III domain-containing protein 1 [Chelonia mydas]|uniref:Ankyrin repeat and fibronectin type-III domain-containing protein 1 n=1 Tax=Chelonia mydas TaxID=8469 RepID=M7BWK9_CHEMY|nr:Ankyrin repeat and fibronectin type-III domain-containing protein 1 [Chelonia mydas]
MTQQMQNLNLSQTKKNSGPSSPNAAKRLYRNLSEKLKGSHASFDEAYFRTRSDRLSLRKTSVNFQCNEAMFEAVEQQDLDTVQILLYQYTPEELDLNTPNSEGLTPLDIAILTNNVPIARILLRIGAKESPHFVNMESRSMHLSTLVQEAQQRVSELSAQVMSEGLSMDNTDKEKQLKAWEWRYRLYKRMKAGYEHARAPEAPTNVCFMVTSSTSLTVTFQEPLSVNSAVVTKYKGAHVNSRADGTLSTLTLSAKDAVSLNEGQDFRKAGILTGLTLVSFKSMVKLNGSCVSGLYIAVIFYYKDNLLVTNEDQIPIVEIDDSHTSSIMQDFLWFTKNLLGTHNLGRVYYEPIKDRHGNILIVTIREVETLYSFFNGKWMQISKLQSQRKSLSTPEEPTALDILLITIQETLSYHKRSQQRLPPGLYLGYLKLCSSVDQIKVLVLQKLPNILCHVKIRDNSNVSNKLSEFSLSKLWVNLYVLFGQKRRIVGRHWRTKVKVIRIIKVTYRDMKFSEVQWLEQESVHFCCYKEKFISLYCHLSAVIELDSLKTQQSLREAISDREVAAAKQRHQQVLDYIQQIDEIWREMRWITEALQYARYKQPVAGLLITKLVDLSEEQNQKKINSTSSHLDCLPSPPPSPEARSQRRKALSDSQPCSDEEGCSEVFLPTDSDYDSSDALSPRELDLVYSSSHDISQQAVGGLGGSAPDVLQVHDMKPHLTLKEDPKGGSDLDADAEYCTEYMNSLTTGGFTSKSLDKTSSSRQPLSFLGKKTKLGKHQHYNYFSRHHRWLRVHSEMQPASLSEGVYTQHLTRATELSQEPTSSHQIRIPVDCPRSAFLPHASSLPEDGKGKYHESRQNIRRIYVEPYKTTLSDEEGKPWALSMQSVEHGDLHGTTGQEMGLDDQSNSPISEVFSSTL